MKKVKKRAREPKPIEWSWRTRTFCVSGNGRFAVHKAAVGKSKLTDISTLKTYFGVKVKRLQELAQEILNKERERR